MQWRFSDGTLVRLGGVVEGGGPMARRLRAELELLPFGRAREVRVGPAPGGLDVLNPNDPRHVHSWVTEWLRWVDGVRLLSAPTLPPLELPVTVPGRVY